MHCTAAVCSGLDCSVPVHVPSDQCVLTNDCDDGVFINTLKHITEVSHHDGCHLYHLPASAAALINLFTHVNIVTGVLHQQELGYFCAKYFMGPTSVQQMCSGGNGLLLSKSCAGLVATWRVSHVTFIA